MEQFIFERHIKVYFGEGCVNQHLPGLLSGYGNNVMLAYGGGSIKRNGVYDEIMDLLKVADKKVVEFPGIMSNPTYEKVKAGAELARCENIDLIIAVGGGSVLDCCKVVSSQAKNKKDLWDMQFTQGKISKDTIPLLVVVTASGTGSEMNPYAVITNEAKKMKATMIGAFADAAFLDPGYTLSLPIPQVLAGAFDTLSHCMETYFGKPHENNLSDDMNEAVMRSVIRYSREVIKNPRNKNIRSELMWASSMAENGILKIGKTMAFQAHHMEHQLGAYTDCSHGQGLAVIHPVFYRHVFEGGIDRFARFAINVWGVLDVGQTKRELAVEGIEKLSSFIKEVGLPTTFREMKIPKDTEFREIADSCNLVTGGCFRSLDHDEIFQILEECY